MLPPLVFIFTTHPTVLLYKASLMSFEKDCRNHRKTLEKLLGECNDTLEHPPNVIAQNRMLLLKAILEKAIMVADETIRAASLQPNEVESILDHFSENAEQYGTNPALDEVDAMRREIERFTRAVDILNALRKRRELSHRLVGHDPRLMGPWARWVRTLEGYKINQDISEKHREGLLADIDSWRDILSST
jgi:hypothetical protein